MVEIHTLDALKRLCTNRVVHCRFKIAHEKWEQKMECFNHLIFIYDSEDQSIRILPENQLDSENKLMNALAWGEVVAEL